MSIAGLLFFKVYNPVILMLQKYKLFVKIKFFFDFFEFYHKIMLVLLFYLLKINYVYWFFRKILFKKKIEGCISL